MWDVFTQMATNLGMSFEYIVMLVLNLGMAPFYAKDFKLGAMFSFFTNALIFMWFYEEALRYKLPLVACLLSLVIMAFTFWAIAKTKAEAGLI